MATITEALAAAVQHHQAGRIMEADQLYRQILAVEPNQADALHYLGLVEHQLGRLDVAISNIRRAIALKGDAVTFHANLGNALADRRDWDEAVACYRRAIELRPDMAQLHNNLGDILRHQGKLDEAVACCGRALELSPDYADAHNNLGALLKDQGRFVEALACCRRALALRPDFADAHNNLGTLLQTSGELDEAGKCFRRAIELNPNFANAYNNLGAILMDQRKLNEAAACFHRSLELEPDNVQAHNNLGLSLAGLGMKDEAVSSYRQALAFDPGFAQAYNNLGIVLAEQGKLEESICYYTQALQLKPGFAQAYNNLGIVLAEQGKMEEAVACYRQALKLEPGFVRALNNLGNALVDQGRLEESEACYRRALNLDRRYAEAHNNLGALLKYHGKLAEAIDCCRRALDLKPDYAEAYSNLGIALMGEGRLEEAVNAHRRAMDLKPDSAKIHSSLLCTLQYLPTETPAGLAVAHAEFGRRHAAPLRSVAQMQGHVRKSDRRLRVGFLSPDFGRHPVGYFLVRCMENLDKSQCEIFCYSNRLAKDEITVRFQNAATGWRDVLGLNDEQLAEAIRADRIDILFDLAGHTWNNRLLVFARKPAPIQIAWIGYEGTTGLQAMTHILADNYTIPIGQEVFYRERVLRMPDGYVCYDPPNGAPMANPLPAAKNGSVCFGSFNNPAKISASVVEVWARILRRVPHSKLLLKYRGMSDESVSKRYLDMFLACGVAPSQLEFKAHSAYSEYLAAYGEVDITLDPFPFGSGITACDSLWMGVPVITCPGETFASRHCLSHVANAGVAETVARDLDDYVELAVSFAGDLTRLAILRGGLREQMATSPLCDGQRFAANLMNVLLRATT